MATEDRSYFGSNRTVEQQQQQLPFYYTNGCRRSNDPASTSLPVCHRTEYRCSVEDAPPEVSQTIRYQYSVQYSSSTNTETLLRYLQETTLEHVAYGLNLMDCPRKRLRNLAVVDSPAVAVAGLPQEAFAKVPLCSDAGSCSGSVHGGVTVFALDEPSLQEATIVVEQSVQEVMGLLAEPGTIERVEFWGFVNQEEQNWYQNRTVQYGFGASLLLILVVCLCGVVCCRCCCRRRQRHGKHRKSIKSPHWQSLDEEQPIAQRDSLALGPQRSWMLRKIRSEPDGGVSEATGDLTNDQHHLSCESESTTANELAKENVSAQQPLEADSVSLDSHDQEQVETDPYILNEVSDDDSEVVAEWRKLHIIEAESTQGYDEEIAEVLGHISFDGESVEK